MLVKPIGEIGQERLANASVLLVGCGALGCALANSLTRAGVGHLRIVDRDWVDLTNLQRQSLFTETDVESGLPKSVVSANRLERINSSINIEPRVADLNFENVLSLCEGVNLLLDGTDNFETRFLLNDAAIKLGIPWVYGGCIGAEGQTMTIVPGETACLHCLMLDGPPPPGTTPTCDTAGILEPIISLVAAIQATEAIKILTGNHEAVNRSLQVIDLWNNEHRSIDLSGLRESVNCPVCKQRQFDWFEGRKGSRTAVLCGRNAVQLSVSGTGPINLAQVASRLESAGDVELNKFLLRVCIDEYQLTLFADGRTIVQGTEDITVAKQIHARFIGA